MVESSQHYARTLGPGYARQTRRAKAPTPVVELARKADQRLGERYRQIARRKHTNQAKSAVAREPIAFLWRALLLVPAYAMIEGERPDTGTSTALCDGALRHDFRLKASPRTKHRAALPRISD
jgi:hypothetical protein